ncbi:divergent PAP2 family protein [Desulfitibacter alkalitolerans]|uniref:divergent PAP2 family protein n=1 Tax=Desulfitibacter alkalitolerans TaxID=264641 RepID=UPI000487BD66|nr:divergent PAP2 family protein [Desulfitibacter alkalitolerans]
MLINYELLSALTAIILAQVLKVILDYFLDGKINLGILISTGGMPSSHTALTAALTTAMGISHGFESPYFTISLVLTLIVAHDAAGVRWQAGKHASEINKIREDLHRLLQSISDNEPPLKHRKELKELLGHKPLEVILGGVMGIIIAVFISLLA